MSYADRLNGFNQAVSSTNDHVKAMKDALNNPDIRENPVKLGLETAGQVTGTIGAVVGGVAQVRDGSVMRNVQKAFFDKLTQAKQAGAPQSVIDGIQSRLEGVMGKAPTGSTPPSAPASSGAQSADGGARGTPEAPSQAPPASDPALDARPPPPSGTASAPEPAAPAAPAATVADESALIPKGDASAFTAQLPSKATQAAPAPSGTAGEAGIGGDFPAAPAPPSAAAAADTASGGASAGAGSNVNSVARNTVPGDNLQPDLPGATTPNTGNPSSDAHAVSQQQSSNATTHSNASDPSQQATSNLAPDAQNQANSSAAHSDPSNAAGESSITADTNAGSTGANVADDAGAGLRTATKVEVGLDELAPDTGPLAPFIEVGSLLATLGTSIAGLFEKKDKTTAAPPPKPGAVPSSLAIGANLKQGAAGSVGAF